MRITIIFPLQNCYEEQMNYREKKHLEQFLVYHIYSIDTGDYNYTLTCNQINVRQNDKVL